MSPARLLEQPFDAVVIGASAGGIEALFALLPSLPAQFQAPVLVVLHLPRERPSALVDIFARKCRLSVREAEDKEPVLPGIIYFAPPDYHLLVDTGPCIALSADEPVHYSRPSIDVLFESAVDVYGRRLLALLLSGANEDGAAGAAAVHRAGGITLIQDPASAPAPTMPLSALKLFQPSAVLSPDAMAQLLATAVLSDAAAGAAPTPHSPAR